MKRTMTFLTGMMAMAMAGVGMYMLSSQNTKDKMNETFESAASDMSKMMKKSSK